MLFVLTEPFQMSIAFCEPAWLGLFVSVTDSTDSNTETMSFWTVSL